MNSENGKTTLILGLVAAVVLVLIFVAAKGGFGSKDSNTATSSSDQMTPVEALTAEDDGVYSVDSADSSIVWFGQKNLLVDWNHEGEVEVQSGTIEVENGQPTTATIVFDLSTITVTKDGAGANPGSGGLVNHLKSDDFFAVETYPTATLEVMELTPLAEEGRYEVTANLTIKDITNPITPSGNAMTIATIPIIFFITSTLRNKSLLPLIFKIFKL